MSETRHASCVAVPEGGVLILGASGRGKSALALRLVALGARLVADDRTDLGVEADTLIASPPETLAGLIEARGLGILRLPFQPRARIALVIDLDRTETERLPPRRHVTVQGIALPLVLGLPHDHFPAAILCYLKGSRFA